MAIRQSGMNGTAGAGSPPATPSRLPLGADEVVNSASNNGMSEMAEDRAQLDPVVNERVIMGQTWRVDNSISFAGASSQMPDPNPYRSSSHHKITHPGACRGRF